MSPGSHGTSRVVLPSKVTTTADVEFTTLRTRGIFGGCGLPNKAHDYQPTPMSSQRPNTTPSPNSSLSTSYEPRQPPPEYRHHLSSHSSNSQHTYVRDHGSEYAVDADESEEEREDVGEMGHPSTARVSDSTTKGGSDAGNTRSMLIRGRRQPSITSSDVEMDIVPGSSTSSAAKMSPGFGSNLKRSLQIDMKDLVGDSVANMSISPGSRDVVLAARRGMYIIDLETPLEVPRFLPQGGTWDVADVQWNPHPTRAEYIVSTSAEKLLIWNLLLKGKTNVEHVLHAHYRAITDINWHTTECDTVVSTGIDSWVWAWDLRDPRKPVFGLSAFKSGGTQVKWNRQDGNILASSHANEVYIWDRRKGSLPITRIRAHNSKIYGIDWSHDLRDEIVTCSLDKSIKVWNISESHLSSRPANNTSFLSNIRGNEEYSIRGPLAQCGPIRMINTHYPVWRARYLPFGRGILSLAQRGETALEMYALNGPLENNMAVEVFEGHTDVVKEFVWRKGDYDEFQLITWSKDRTLKFWPIDADVLQKVNYVPDLSRSKHRTGTRTHAISFRNPADGAEHATALLEHIKNRPAFIETRPLTLPDNGSEGASRTTSKPINVLTHTSTRLRGETMTRGITGKSVARMDAFTWLSNVKVGDRKEGSSDAASRERDGRSRSRLSLKMKQLDPVAATVGDRLMGPVRRRSESRPNLKAMDGQDLTGQSLQDEITTVLTKLAAHKIKLEKHDLTKKRNCTLGLHGPWGEVHKLQVFIRVTFTFPRDYAYTKYPHGIPTVELERNPLIPMPLRAFMLRRLRTIRERRRPCLEACLRFLLFGNEEEEQPGPVLHMDSESSSDEESTFAGRERKKRKKEVHGISMLTNHKNLAEPRTSQGTFGPNGELVCFFRASPRIVRNVLRGLTNGTASGSDVTPMSPPKQLEELPVTPHPAPGFPDPEGGGSGMPGMLRSPTLVRDAVYKLGVAAKDCGKGTMKAEAGNDIVRVMANVLAYSRQQKSRRESEGSHHHHPMSGSVNAGEGGRDYAFPATRSTVFLVSTNETAGPDKKVAVGYIYACPEEAGLLTEVCARNANNARACGRYDHERVFKMMQTLFVEKETGFASDALARQVVLDLYTDFAKNKDVQMLGMLSMLILQTKHCTPPMPTTRTTTQQQQPQPQRPTSRLEFGGAVPKGGPVDYFNLTRAINGGAGIPPSSPEWPRLPTIPPLSPQPAFSRGSWSSLFGAGGVRQFVQETFTKDGLQTPTIVLDSAALAENGVKGGDQGGGKAGRTLSGGSGGGRPAESVGVVVASKQQQQQTQQQTQQKKGKQRRESAHAVLQPQPQPPGHNAQIGPRSMQPPQEGSSPAALPPPPSTRPRSEMAPGPLKTSLSFSSTSSGGSSSGTGGSGMKRSPLVSVENVDLGLRRRGGKETDKGKKRVVVFHEEGEDRAPPLFDWQLVEQFKAHVHAYAEILHRWKMDQQRLEMLKAVAKNMSLQNEMEGHGINVSKVCGVCLATADRSGCPVCGSRIGALLCSVCRLPVKGLSRTCMMCFHVGHMSCLKKMTVPMCPTGCGCFCEGDVSEVASVVGQASQHLPASTRASSVMPADFDAVQYYHRSQYTPSPSLLLS